MVAGLDSACMFKEAACSLEPVILYTVPNSVVLATVVCGSISTYLVAFWIGEMLALCVGVVETSVIALISASLISEPLSIKHTGLNCPLSCLQ